MKKPPTTSIAELGAWAKQGFDERTPDNQVRRELYMVSPDRSVWQLVVDDAGAVSTVKVRDGV